MLHRYDKDLLLNTDAVIDIQTSVGVEGGRVKAMEEGLGVKIYLLLTRTSPHPYCLIPQIWTAISRLINNVIRTSVLNIFRR